MDEKINNCVPVVADPLQLNMDQKSLDNLNAVTVGSVTIGNFQPPQGQKMKLDISGVAHDDASGHTRNSQVFGTHIQEAIAIVKDWANRP